MKLNNNTRVLLIIPAYNEEKNILSVCKSIDDYNKYAPNKLDYIIVNDGSTDGTKSVCNINKLPYLNLCINSGIGNCVQTGYKYAKLHNYDIAIQFDGDGQHDVEYVDILIKPIRENQANIVIGSRFLNKQSSKFKSSYARRIGIKLISFFIKVFTGTRIYDATSGFRAVDRTLIKIFADNYPSEYPEPVSITSLAKQEWKIKEVPVSMNERTQGKSSIKAWRTVYFMMNVILSVIIEAIGGYKYEH